MKRAISVIVVFILLSAAFVAMTPRRERPKSDRPVVAVTIFPLYDLVRRVGDGVTDTVLILPPGAEPHDFEPTPSAIRDVQAASAIYAIGHGLDGWVTEIAPSGIAVVTADRGIVLRRAEAGEDGVVSSEGGSALGGDPHYWLSVPNAARIAGTVADDLSARFPESRARIEANLAALVAELDALDAEVRATLSAVSSKDIITFHEAWYYFAEEYGLTVAGVFESAPGQEPSPRDLAELLKTARREKIPALYHEPLFSSAAVAAFAEENGLRLAALDDIGGVPGRDSYDSLMRSNARTIADNQR